MGTLNKRDVKYFVAVATTKTYVVVAHPGLSEDEVVDLFNDGAGTFIRETEGRPSVSGEHLNTSRQTSCRHCALDIENMYPYPAGQWRDRGGETKCSSKLYRGRNHAPPMEDSE